jgi:2-keto-4-pentenoate hydratase/2-oxohepta-3-ene-1,7-dioic acid hydratase in catechol pathway
MKLLRYGPAGAEKPGLLDAHGTLRDLSAHLQDLDAAALAPQALARLRALDVPSLPPVAGTPRLGLPFTGTRQFIAVGLNYVDHAAEAGMRVPKEPILFTKAVSCLQGPDDEVRRPRNSQKMDWEVELGIVIGSAAHYVDRAQALDHVAGYVIVDDLSEREFQTERGGTWDKGKGCETFGPVGPWLVTADEILEVQSLGLWLDVNGEPMQRGNTSNMIFDCATLVSYISQFMRLLPGDIITTGTPPGVGMAKNPPRFLREGDVVTLGIDGLGRQEHRVIAWDAGREVTSGSKEAP